MKVFVYGFWDGFLDKRDAVHIDFFKQLLGLVFGCEIEVGGFQDSEILLESIFSNNTALHSRPWKYSFLYSGESRLNPWAAAYSCVLYGERNHDNVVNLPLFLPYIYCSKNVDKLTSNARYTITRVPPRNICAVISNGGGAQRNHILSRIDQRIPIDFAGRYRTNVDIITEPYHTDAFSRKIGEYKFVVAMENSVGETYITEKITHGFYADTIPIYFGSPNVGDYFNLARIINVADTSDDTIDAAIDRMLELIRDESKYIEAVNLPILRNTVSIHNVAADIRALI